MASITITHTDIGTKTVHQGLLQYGWKNLVNPYPVEGKFGIQEAVKNGWSNPRMTLTLYFPDEPSSYYTSNSILSWEDWNTLARNEYDGTSSTKITLTATAGINDTPFVSYAASAAGTSTIPLEIVDFTVSLDPEESKDGGLWTVQARVLETV